jgi:4,5-DOPA dioxygenase extradiol
MAKTAKAPEELYRVKYPARGSTEYAALIKLLIKSVRVDLDNEWGLDHGTWSVLINMYPKADVPVLQLSLDYYLPLAIQYQIGRDLKPL